MFVSVHSVNWLCLPVWKKWSMCVLCSLVLTFPLSLQPDALEVSPGWVHAPSGCGWARMVAGVLVGGMGPSWLAARPACAGRTPGTTGCRLSPVCFGPAGMWGFIPQSWSCPGGVLLPTEAPSPGVVAVLCSYNCSVSVGGGEPGVFQPCHLDPFSPSLFYTKFLKSITEITG